jgi:four helix bundle protein
MEVTGMATIRDHKDLRVWKEGMRLAVDIYQITKSLPRDERFGIVAQMRRAAVSVPTNIAEGAGRRTAADFARFLAIARGSLAELETQLLLCEELRLLGASRSIHERIRYIRLMLTNLGKRLRERL